MKTPRTAEQVAQELCTVMTLDNLPFGQKFKPTAALIAACKGHEAMDEEDMEILAAGGDIEDWVRNCRPEYAAISEQLANIFNQHP